MIQPRAQSKMYGKVRRATVVLRVPTPAYEKFFERAICCRYSMNALAVALIEHFNDMQTADVEAFLKRLEAKRNVIGSDVVVHDRAAA